MKAKLASTALDRAEKDVGGSPYALVREIALAFIKQYAIDHEFFTGGDVLAAFRESKLPASQVGWRNKWGAVINEGNNRGWYRKSGRAKPTSKQSHTGSLVQWQSLLFKGTQSLVGKTAREQVEEIRRDFVTKKIKDLRAALWKAYELGVEHMTESK